MFLEILKEYFLCFHHIEIIKACEENLPQIAELFLKYPERYIELLKSALKESQLHILKKSKDGSTKKTCQQDYIIKIANMPICPEIMRSSLPLVEDLGKFLSIKGIVIRTGLVKMLEMENWFVCEKCFKSFRVSVSIVKNPSTKKPDKCVDIECHSTKFRALRPDERSDDKLGSPIHTIDYQEIKIQEKTFVNKPPSSRSDHSKRSDKISPISRRSLTIILSGSCDVDRCKVGDDVIVNGTLCLRWLYVPSPQSAGSGDDGPRLELVLKANHIETLDDKGNSPKLYETFGSVGNESNRTEAEVSCSISYSPIVSQAIERPIRTISEEFSLFWKSNAQAPFRARNLILASICPQIYGLYSIKLAVSLVLAGGVGQINQDGSSTIRGESHLLLVGDPGTGKSQFLKYVTKIMPRAVYTTGIGSTSAGLTVAAVKESNDWGLEAGALVMADGGVCCIDEFNCIREADRATIHEAMEQQTISVAKAGIVCKLSCKTSIMATANPKGKYDPSLPITINTAMSGALISRFDLIFVLLDVSDRDWDLMVSAHIINGYSAPSPKSVAGGESLSDEGAAPTSERSLWSLNKIKAYFSIIRGLRPTMTEDGNRILSRYYCAHRQRQDRNAARSTVRLLESLVRLAQAHAKLMYHERVEIQDAVSAICIMECSLQSSRLRTADHPDDGENSLAPLLFKSTTTFPTDADEEYKIQERIILDHFFN